MAGNVRVVRAPWNEVLIQELEQFPDGAHDDQVDGVSGAFNTLSELWAPPIRAPKKPDATRWGNRARGF